MATTRLHPLRAEEHCHPGTPNLACKAKMRRSAALSRVIIEGGRAGARRRRGHRCSAAGEDQSAIGEAVSPTRAQSKMWRAHQRVWIGVGQHLVGCSSSWWCLECWGQGLLMSLRSAAACSGVQHHGTGEQQHRTELGSQKHRPGRAPPSRSMLQPKLGTSGTEKE